MTAKKLQHAQEEANTRRSVVAEADLALEVRFLTLVGTGFRPSTVGSRSHETEP